MAWQECRADLGLPTEKDEALEWKESVQVQPTGQPANAAEPPAKQEPPAKPADTVARSLVRANLERLIERLKKDKAGHLPKHRAVFDESLPGFERFTDELFSELDAVLVEQRSAVLGRYDLDELTTRAMESLPH
jgi:hypothetical protein